jgi:hypothetical protein
MNGYHYLIEHILKKCYQMEAYANFTAQRPAKGAWLFFYQQFGEKIILTKGSDHVQSFFKK